MSNPDMKLGTNTNLNIDTVEKLRVHLKILKRMFLKEGAYKLHLYPLFCLYYDKNKEYYHLPKEEVFDIACEIFIEED